MPLPEDQLTGFLTTFQSIYPQTSFHVREQEQTDSNEQIQARLGNPDLPLLNLERPAQARGEGWGPCRA